MENILILAIVGVVVAVGWYVSLRKCAHGVRIGPCKECSREAEELRSRRRAERMEAQQAYFVKRQNELIESKEREFKRMRELSSLNALHPYAFELLVIALFRKMGWSAEATPQTGDKGVDGRLAKESKKYVLQCKRLSGGSVGVAVARDLYGVMVSERVDGGFIVTTGTFTSGVVEWIKGKAIELVDGPKLIALLREHFPDCRDLPDDYAEECLVRDRAAQRKERLRACLEEPCPRCGRKLELKSGRYGRFLGCKGYPTCRYKRKLEEIEE